MACLIVWNCNYNSIIAQTHYWCDTNNLKEIPFFILTFLHVYDVNKTCGYLLDLIYSHKETSILLEYDQSLSYPSIISSPCIYHGCVVKLHLIPPIPLPRPPPLPGHLPACTPLFLDLVFLLFSCPLRSSGDGRAGPEKIPAEDRGAPLGH